MVWTITSSARVEQNCGKHLKGNLLKLGGEWRVMSGETEAIPERDSWRAARHLESGNVESKACVASDRNAGKMETREPGRCGIARSQDGLGKFYD
jgi:hypothetical protein